MFGSLLSLLSISTSKAFSVHVAGKRRSSHNFFGILLALCMALCAHSASHMAIAHWGTLIMPPTPEDFNSDLNYNGHVCRSRIHDPHLLHPIFY